MSTDRIYRNITSTGWRRALDEIKAGQKQYQEYAPIMTPFERVTVEQDLKERRERYELVIVNGVLDEFHQARAVLKLRNQEAKQAAANENKRWDMVRFANEAQAINVQLDLAAQSSRVYDPMRKGVSPAETIQKIYDEAMQSGDVYRQRAACEVCQGALTKFQGVPDEIRLAANRVALRAEKDLPAVRTTPEMDQAQKALQSEFTNFQKVRAEVVQVAKDLGQDTIWGGHFTTSLRTVEVDDAGELKIYDESDFSGGMLKSEQNRRGQNE